MGSQRILSRSMQYWLFLLSTLFEPTFSPAFCITKIPIQQILSGKTAKTGKGFGKEKGRFPKR